MCPSLSALREQTPQPSPAEFLRWHPLCLVEFFDDTPAREPAKFLATATIDPELIERKQREGCAVCFTLQGFEGSRTLKGFRTYRNMGIDVDLVRDPGGSAIPAEEIDWRKDWYLAHCLFRFPLRPHWVIETRRGFHVIFRVAPVREALAVREAAELNRRLVAALQGDNRSAHLRQLARMPGCSQFTNPAQPFLCRLVYRAEALPPYALPTVRSAVESWEGRHAAEGREAEAPWIGGTRQAHMPVVARGKRQVAASVVGGILCRLPQALWEVAGLGGLREWNRRNPEPLSERQVRHIYEWVAGRERNRRSSTPAPHPTPPAPVALPANRTRSSEPDDDLLDEYRW